MASLSLFSCDGLKLSFLSSNYVDSPSPPKTGAIKKQHQVVRRLPLLFQSSLEGVAYLTFLVLGERQFNCAKCRRHYRHCFCVDAQPMRSSTRRDNADFPG
ncbi:hypothetical protein JCM1840_002669 [Sporobolomyces johnsonii]